MALHPPASRYICLSFILIACLGANACAPGHEDCYQVDTRCAGLVTDFGPVDEGMPRQAWLALEDARSAGLLDRVDYIETTDTRDRGPNISTFADSGYDIIVTVGAGISDETVSAALSYPDLAFVGVQQPTEEQLLPPNLATLTFDEPASGFLAGAAAGLMSRTQHVAAICEVDFIETVREYCEGFRSGVAYVDQEADVVVRYRSGSEELLFHDVEWGRSAALVAVEDGADVVFAVGEETAEAALAAAASRGATVIGAETDQYLDVPGIRPRLLTSAILDVRAGILALLREVIVGGLRGGVFPGGVALAPFHEFDGRIAPEVRARLQEIAEGLESGDIRADAFR